MQETNTRVAIVVEKGTDGFIAYPQNAAGRQETDSSVGGAVAKVIKNQKISDYTILFKFDPAPSK